jgi:P-type Ca2+ transporter type 2C
VSLGVPEALAALGSSRRGLSEQEVLRRRADAGPNVLPRARGRSVWAELAAQLANMFAVVLLVAAGLTFLIYARSVPRDPANLILAFGILGVVVLNALIGFAQEHAAERTAEALQAMVPRRARVLRGGQLTEIPAEDLVPGDVVSLEAGDAISADARLVEAHALSIEMAALTGESQPVGRTSEPAPAGAQPSRSRNCVFMGTSVTAGAGKAVVFATGLGTEFGRIYRLTAGVPAEESPLQRQVTDMARRVAAVAIAAGVLLFALRVLSGSAVASAFVFALGVMVALVPEGLPATLSVSLAIGVRRMARRDALIKRLAAVEALGSTTVICTDKTGTLTKAEMTVQQVFASGRSHAVTGAGYDPAGQVEDPGPVAGVLRAGALCCDARLLAPSGRKGWRILGDTTEGAILVAAVKAGLDLAAEAARTPRVGVLPFHPGRKLMTTIHRVGGGYEAYVKGSPQAVLERCTHACWQGRVVPLEAGLRREITGVNDAMAAQAMRVLAVASKTVGSLPATIIGMAARAGPG